jgi:hypothetical protein
MTITQNFAAVETAVSDSQKLFVAAASASAFIEQLLKQQVVEQEAALERLKDSLEGLDLNDAAGLATALLVCAVQKVDGMKIPQTASEKLNLAKVVLSARYQADW